MGGFSGLSICFDLDGTLVDTAPDLVRVLNLVISEEGLPPTEYAKARGQVGFGAKALIVQACSRADHAISDERVSQLWHLFIKHYQDNIAELSKPFSGVIDTLRLLRNGGAKMSVCTNKPGYLARKLLDELKMSTYFDRVIGSGDGVATKPSPQHIFAATGHRRKSGIIMVGDSAPDVMAARAAGVPIVLFRYGYAGTPADRLRADKILRRFRELPETLLSLTGPVAPI